MRRLTGLGRRQVTVRPGRALLTASGIVLGVSTLFGTLVAGGSVQRGFEQLAAEVSGASDVQVAPIGAQGTTMPVSFIDRVRTMPDVVLAAPSLWRQVRASSGGRSLDIALGGVTDDVDRVSSVTVDAGRSPAEGAEEIALSHVAADRLGVGVGDAVVVAPLTGDVRARVVGLLADAGLAKANDGHMALTSLPTAQRMQGVTGIGGIDIVLQDGVQPETWIDEHADSFTGVDVRPAEDAGANFSSFLSIIRSSLTLSALLAMFVGVFLIYLTLSVAVVERTRTYGTLRAVGATPRQIRRVVVTEALALGVPATAVGLVLGAVLALALIRVLAGLVNVPTPPLALSVPSVVGAAVIGLGSTLLAALVPAGSAARISPVVAMRGNVEARTRLSKAWIAGVVIFGCGAAMSAWVPGVVGSGGGSLLTLLGAVLLVPPLLRPLSRVVGWFTRRLAPGVGAMAVSHLAKERSRSAYTLALVMVVLAQVFVIATVTTSVARAFDDVIDHQFDFDVEVFQNFGALRPSTVDAIRSSPNVARTAELRFGRSEYVDGAKKVNTRLLIIDPQAYFAMSTFAWRHGDDDSVRVALDKGGSVVVDDIFASNHELGVGDTVMLRTLAGPKPFAVAGVYRSLSDQLIVGASDGRVLFGAGPVSALIVDGAPGTTSTELKRELDRIVGTGNESSGAEVWTAEDFRREEVGSLNGFTSVFYAVVGVALVAGLLGLANTLAMSVVQRSREIGILRSVGTTPRQIVAMVVVESVTMALVAVVLALPLGLLVSRIFTTSVGETFGLSSQYTVPWSAVPTVLAMALGVALLAAIAPARRAGRIQVVESLQFE